VAAATPGPHSARYEQTLQAAGALDFDDLLLRTVALSTAIAAVRDAYRPRFPYVLVDEYQDTNRAQYELVRHLAGRRETSPWWGTRTSPSTPGGAPTSRTSSTSRPTFPGARVLRLEENYRSSPAILDAASALVAHNRRRKGKTLRAVKPAGDKVRLHQAADEYQEAAWVVDRIAGLRDAGRAAVLFRMNAQSRLFEEGLMRHRIPYEVVGGVGFYERKEVKDLLSYLRLILNPRDPIALRRVINVPPRGIGDKTVDEVARAAAARGVSPWEALGRGGGGGPAAGRATQPLRRFREMIAGLREDATRLGCEGPLDPAPSR
jgi:DNA helicase-2/ATP-dependent DNA helicase PcrA